MNNITFTSLPKDLYIIYLIEVGNKIYVGASRSIYSRLQTHSSNLNKIIKNKKKDTRTSIDYKLFNISDLILYGYRFSIYCYCDIPQTARQVEEYLITKYKKSDLSLNTSDKSGLHIKQTKRKKHKRSRYQPYI